MGSRAVEPLMGSRAVEPLVGSRAVETLMGPRAGRGGSRAPPRRGSGPDLPPQPCSRLAASCMMHVVHDPQSAARRRQGLRMWGGDDVPALPRDLVDQRLRGGAGEGRLREPPHADPGVLRAQPLRHAVEQLAAYGSRRGGGIGRGEAGVWVGKRQRQGYGSRRDSVVAKFRHSSQRNPFRDPLLAPPHLADVEEADRALHPRPPPAPWGEAELLHLQPGARSPRTGRDALRKGDASSAVARRLTRRLGGREPCCMTMRQRA
eukprot:gene11806-biopygen2586